MNEGYHYNSESKQEMPILRGFDGDFKWNRKTAFRINYVLIDILFCNSLKSLKQKLLDVGFSSCSL